MFWPPCSTWLGRFFLTSATLSSELSLTSAFMSVSEECVTNTVTLMLLLAVGVVCGWRRPMKECKPRGQGRDERELSKNGAFLYTECSAFYRQPAAAISTS